jgi:hypothetical protein
MGHMGCCFDKEKNVKRYSDPRTAYMLVVRVAWYRKSKHLIKLPGMKYKRWIINTNDVIFFKKVLLHGYKKDVGKITSVLWDLLYFIKTTHIITPNKAWIPVT